MAASPFTEPTAPATAPAIQPAIVASSDPQIISGARWFWWIAGLSAVNTALIHSGSDTSFVIGLGFTLIADSIFSELKVIAFAIDAVAIGSFVALGWFSGKGHVWAFITGIVLYAIDALIYVPVQQWMSVGFHVFALFFIFRAMLRLRAGLKAARTAAVVTDIPAPPPLV
jgi:hypothetical protein